MSLYLKREVLLYGRADSTIGGTPLFSVLTFRGLSTKGLVLHCLSLARWVNSVYKHAIKICMHFEPRPGDRNITSLFTKSSALCQNDCIYYAICSTG
jgi:hypothetical protein